MFTFFHRGLCDVLTIYYKLSHSFSLYDYRSYLFGSVNEAIGQMILDDFHGIDTILKKIEKKLWIAWLNIAFLKKINIIFILKENVIIYSSYFSRII